ncbi:hypothetical protein CALCODRAFT_420767, partial [Calocera cornea HHB12733]
RCRDCFLEVELCSICQVDVHSRNPLHWIETWNGDFFERTSLQKLGLTIHLGHRGLPCPTTSSATPVAFTIVHINGVHNVSLAFCSCDGASERYLQLLGSRLFPVTYELPKTAFTFAVLKDFHLHTLCSKKSAYDYYAKLVRQTSDVSPASANDRYRELLRASRVWMDLESSRRSGSDHGLARDLPQFAAAAIRSPLCPACPQMGINVTAGDIAEMGHSKPHLLTLYLGGDGNFTLSSKQKTTDANDVPLNNGEGFFPNQHRFEKFIQKHEDLQLVRSTPPDSTGTCSGFKTSMLFQGNLGYRSSGVYSWTCLRHGLYRPRGTVDLQIGERYT